PFSPIVGMYVGDEEAVDLEIIDEFIQKFGPAVLHIKKQRVIGVGAAGVEMYRNGRLCWLLIATKYKVYFFDVLQLGTWAFKNGLSMILESRHILKVIHDCRSIAGCLISQFGVKLANVFDTQVADVLCFRSETGGFLPDRLSTLEETLLVTNTCVCSPLCSSQEEQEVWYTRPCPAALLKPMGLSVIHLLPLRMQLMDDLMTDCLLLVDCYLNTSHYLPDEMEHASPVGHRRRIYDL
uniref:Exonuclease 3'-5' domain containing 1 n=1 Tax=Salarias fasciatus TaxID=181472 RepID=A0A672GWJ5_SALFA